MFFQLLRIPQYVKNLFVLCPLFFAGKLRQTEILGEALLAALFFGIVSSSVYILNDILDRERDRQHPSKRNRPIANGDIGTARAMGVALLLVMTGLAGAFFLDTNAGWTLLVYVVLNLFYSFSWKHIAILDICCIAFGFVLRLIVGSCVSDVALSHWIIIMTFLLALFLALAKRRDDVLLYQRDQVKARQVIDGYNLEFLGSAMMVMASVTIVSYLLYCVSPEVRSKPGHENLYLTVVFVVIGIMRYMQQTFVHEKSSSPTRLVLQDRFLQLILVCWIATFAWFLY